MKKIALAACIIFAVLTFVGIGYALWKGKNAGYAVIPMVIFVASLAFYRSKDKKIRRLRKARTLSVFCLEFSTELRKEVADGAQGIQRSHQKRGAEQRDQALQDVAHDSRGSP